MIEIEPVLKSLGLEKSPCPIKFTSAHLRFYELGAYFETSTESWIELNPKNHFSWLGYNYEITLKHELIHALRKHYPDTYWEELLAYQCSHHAYQRLLGPLLASKASKGLLLLSPLLCWLSLGIPLALLWSILLLRHLKQRLKFQKVICFYIKKGCSQQQAFQQMLQLSPQELEALAKKAPSGVRNF